MTPVSTFNGRSVALFGLGGSGLATAKALIAGGANVTAWDDSEAGRAKALAEKIHVEDLDGADWSRFDALILTPGAPLTHPVAALDRPARQGAGHRGDRRHRTLLPGTRRARGRRAFRRDHRHQWQVDDDGADRPYSAQAGRDAQLGGNIGTPILALEPPDDARIHVIECSSFQIDLAPSLAPTIGILINLTPDHLDRHGTMENYAAIKERLVAGAEIALVGVDDAYCHAIGARLTQRARPDQRVAPVSAERALDWGFYLDGDNIMFREKDHPPEEAELLCSLKGARALRGAHNAQNAVFAAAACWELGLEDEEIARGLLELSRPAASHGGGRAAGARPFRQRQQGDQRRRRLQGARELYRHLLDHRRQGQGGRHRVAAGLLSRWWSRPI